MDSIMLLRKGKRESNKYKWLAEQEGRSKGFPESERDAWPSLSRRHR